MRLSGRLFTAALLILLAGGVRAETVLVVETMPVPAIAQHRDAFLETLSAVDPTGRFTIVRFQADGDLQRAVDFLERPLPTGKPDLVVTFATLATQAATSVFGPDSGVPVIFAVVVDPVGAGVVREIGVASRTNVAGVVYTVDREVKIATALRILETQGGFSGVTVGIPHSSYRSSRDDVWALRRAAASFPGFRVVDAEFAYSAVPQGVPAMRERMAAVIREMDRDVDWWWEAVGPMSERPESVADIVAVSNRPVLFASHPDGVADGALLSISPDPVASGRRLAGIALEVLSGADPGGIPVLPAPDFVAAVNVSTARRHGLVVPSYLLELAGRHVYR